MANDIKFEIDKDSEKLINALLSKNILGTKKIFTDIGTEYRQHIKDQFSNPSLRDESLSWPALKPLTVAYKKEKYGRDKGILIGSGKLMKSMTQKSAEGNITEIGTRQASFGTSIPYAKYHYYGAPSRTVKSQKQSNFLRFGLKMWGKKVGAPIPLPKRDMVSPNQSVSQKWADIIRMGIAQNFKNSQVFVS